MQSPENCEQYSEHQYYLLILCRKSCLTCWTLWWNRFRKWLLVCLKVLDFIDPKIVANLIYTNIVDRIFNSMVGTRWMSFFVCVYYYFCWCFSGLWASRTRVHCVRPQLKCQQWHGRTLAVWKTSSVSCKNWSSTRLSTPTSSSSSAWLRRRAFFSTDLLAAVKHCSQRPSRTSVRQISSRSKDRNCWRCGLESRRLMFATFSIR